MGFAKFGVLTGGANEQSFFIMYIFFVKNESLKGSKRDF